MCKYAISSSTNTIKKIEDNTDDIDYVMEMMRRERSANLVSDLIKIFKCDILSLCKKTLEMEAGTEMFLEETTMENIISDIISLGEREPYGVRGGAIVVRFVTHSDEVVRIGKFAIDSNTIPTFELHLTLSTSTNILHKAANLVKRMQARPPVVFVHEKYQLDKVKLYRL